MNPKQLFPSNDFDIAINSSSEMVQNAKEELLEKIYELEDNIINYIVNKEMLTRKQQLVKMGIFTQQEVEMIVKKEFF